MKSRSQPLGRWADPITMVYWQHGPAIGPIGPVHGPGMGPLLATIAASDRVGPAAGRPAAALWMQFYTIRYIYIYLYIYILHNVQSYMHQ